MSSGRFGRMVSRSGTSDAVGMGSCAEAVELQTPARASVAAVAIRLILIDTPPVGPARPLREVYRVTRSRHGRATRGSDDRAEPEFVASTDRRGGGRCRGLP